MLTWDRVMGAGRRLEPLGSDTKDVVLTAQSELEVEREQDQEVEQEPE